MVSEFFEDNHARYSAKFVDKLSELASAYLVQTVEQINANVIARD